MNSTIHSSRRNLLCDVHQKDKKKITQMETFCLPIVVICETIYNIKSSEVCLAKKERKKHTHAYKLDRTKIGCYGKHVVVRRGFL